MRISENLLLREQTLVLTFLHKRGVFEGISHELGLDLQAAGLHRTHNGLLV